MHAHQHLRPAPERRQRLQRLRRQRGQAKDDHAPRQPGRARGGAVAQDVHEAAVHLGAAGGGLLRPGVGLQRAPQARLPALVVWQGLAPLARGDQGVVARAPGLQPVRAVHLVLLEQRGQALGELVAPAQPGVVAQVARQRREGRVVEQGGQQAHQAPLQAVGVEGRDARHRARAQHLAVGLPDEALRQQRAHRRGDAQAPCAGLARHRELEPLRHAMALDEHHLVLQRRDGMGAHPLQHQVAQRLQAVALDDHEAGSQWEGTVHRSSSRKLTPCG